jgi:hypothetical protein
MASLYQLGWRQGSAVIVPLEAPTAVTGDSTAETLSIPHDRWIVASQDCDLAAIDSENPDPRIELRPIYDEAGGPDFDRGGPNVWGVRSRKFRLNAAKDFVHADSPRLMVAPSLLNRYADARESIVSDERRAAYTSWLGRRYDRPAVPDASVPLARAVSRLASNTDHPIRNHVHDLLMAFDDRQTPTGVSLFAIVCDLDHSEECCPDRCSDDHIADARAWMSEVAQALDIELGVVVGIEAAARDGTSMMIVEGSYSADVSDITYRGDGVSGVG